ncbi:Uncharacterised protein [Klebsiella variicola]|uniref:Uncharacterized protein n=1 Tax=Klebsiella variicola TaxID=244366 RepID=A0A7H4MHQ3_KLEVA|nr:Uncharacterised protein [Klebsiella variicola]
MVECASEISTVRHPSADAARQVVSTPEFGFHPGNNQLFYAGLGEPMRKVSVLETGGVPFNKDDIPLAVNTHLRQQLG